MTGAPPRVTRFFQGKPQGSWHRLQIARDLTSSDIRQQFDASGGTPVLEGDWPAQAEPRLAHGAR
jgi:hypothetical protein